MWIQFDTESSQREMIQMVRARYSRSGSSGQRITLESEHHLYDFWFETPTEGDSFWNQIQTAVREQKNYLDLTGGDRTWTCSGMSEQLYNVHVGDGIMDVRVANVVEVKNEELGGMLEVSMMKSA